MPAVPGSASVATVVSVPSIIVCLFALCRRPPSSSGSVRAGGAARPHEAGGERGVGRRRRRQVAPHRFGRYLLKYRRRIGWRKAARLLLPDREQGAHRLPRADAAGGPGHHRGLRLRVARPRRDRMPWRCLGIGTYFNRLLAMVLGPVADVPRIPRRLVLTIKARSSGKAPPPPPPRARQDREERKRSRLLVVGGRESTIPADGGSALEWLRKMSARSRAGWARRSGDLNGRKSEATAAVERRRRPRATPGRNGGASRCRRLGSFLPLVPASRRKAFRAFDCGLRDGRSFLTADSR